MSTLQIVVAVVLLVFGAPIVAVIGWMFFRARPKKPQAEREVETGVPFRWSFPATGQWASVWVRVTVGMAHGERFGSNLGLWGTIALDGEEHAVSFGGLSERASNDTGLYRNVVRMRNQGTVTGSVQVARLRARSVGEEHVVTGTLHGAATTSRIRIQVQV